MSMLFAPRENDYNELVALVAQTKNLDEQVAFLNIYQYGVHVEKHGEKRLAFSEWAYRKAEAKAAQEIAFIEAR